MVIELDIFTLTHDLSLPIRQASCGLNFLNDSANFKISVFKQ